MADQSAVHNKLASEVVTHIVKTVYASGGSMTEVMVVCESVLVGIALAGVRFGGDEKMLDIMVTNARKRLADAHSWERVRQMGKLSDDDLNDIAEDYRHEQAYFNSLSTPPMPTESRVARYFKGFDCPDSTTADVVYIDRLTGKEVMRYDGADPANTRFDYGATPDADIFQKRGMNIKETIDPAAAVVSIQECRNRMRVDHWADY